MSSAICERNMMHSTIPSISRASASAAVAAVSAVKSQIIIKVNNAKSHVLEFDCYQPQSSDILHQLSIQTCIPSCHLHLQHYDWNVSNLHRSSNDGSDNTSPPSISVSFLSAHTNGVLGGKGGFGTLLKGQSKMAAATRTIDFGACRDLNGRRLRHVNDEIKLRRWRMVQQAAKDLMDKTGGVGDEWGRKTVELELEGMKTESGIRNWHLSVPGWSEVSGKERKKGERLWRKEIEKVVKERRREQFKRDKVRNERDRVVTDYANKATTATIDPTDTMEDAIAQGMRKRRKLGKQQQQQINSNDMDDSTSKPHTITMKTTPLPYLRILSGNFDIDIDTNTADNDNVDYTSVQSTSTTFNIQSKSVFATAAILLDQPTPTGSTPSKPLYYEITIQTAGISQLGWAHLANAPSSSTPAASTSNTPVVNHTNNNNLLFFQPNSDTGDGVGDDASSYGYDGFRGSFFHKEVETPYGRQQGQDDDDNDEKNNDTNDGGTNTRPWTEGDVVGCLYDSTKGTMHYYLNGTDLGVAITVESTIAPSTSTMGTKKEIMPPRLCPVWSMDEDEIISVNIGPNFKFTPTSSTSSSNEKSLDITGVCDLVTTDAVEAKAEECSSIKVGLGVTVAAPSNIATKDPSSVCATPKLIANEPNAANSSSTKKDAVSKKVNLNDFESAKALEELGMDQLKVSLFALGCKFGGSLDERAKRLFLVKDMEKKDYPMKVRGHNFAL